MTLDHDREQEARIALLEHHTSQMQGYKIYILTLAVALLTVFEIWGRLQELNCTLPAGLIMSSAIGVILATAIWCVPRMLWYGQLIRSAIRAPRKPQAEFKLLIHQVDEGIIHHAEREAEGKGDQKQNWILRKLIGLGDHRKPFWLVVIWIVSFVALTFLILRLAPLFGLGPGVRIVATESNATIDFTMILSQVPLVVATFLVAVATYFVYHATKEMAHNIIRPFLIMRATTTHQREEYFTPRNFPLVSEEVLRSFIEKRGIVVENVGLGPAVMGTVTVRIDGRTLSETFLRLHRSEAGGTFRYFHPSPDSPEIMIPEDIHEISVEAQYYDIAEKHYCQRPQRIDI